MSGHQAHNQSHGTNPLRVDTPDLNHQAALIAAARLEGNPYADHLAAIEPKFTAELTRQLDGVDHALIGAVLLTAGQLTASVLAMLSPESRPHAGPIAVNLLQLAGQQLYQGKMQHHAACPYPLATGKPCGHVAKGETEEQLDAVMRGHVGLHHPGEKWSPTESSEVEPTEETAYCACGKPADLIVGITNRPNGGPGEAKAICRDCHQRDTEGVSADA